MTGRAHGQGSFAGIGAGLKEPREGSEEMAKGGRQETKNEKSGSLGYPMAGETCDLWTKHHAPCSGCQIS